MPCMTYEPPEEIAARELANEKERQDRATQPLIAKIGIQGRQIAELEAMLCGVLTTMAYLDGYNDASVQVNGNYFKFYDVIRDWFNEEESGVTWVQLENWWTEHKAADKRRKEAEQVILEVKRRTALAKLTSEERALLGL